jgi:replicative DNA helicase
MTDIIYSPHAEEALVGATINNAYDVLNRVMVEATEFSDSRYGIIWSVLLEMYNRGAGIDYVTVCNRLDGLGKLAEIGGDSYLTKLISSNFSSMGVEEYARTIKDKAARTRTLRLAGDLATLAADESKDLSQSIGQVMTDLTKTASITQGAVSWSRFLGQSYDLVEERAKNPQDTWGIQTGFSDYDRMTGGLQQTEIMLLSGEPGKGKSIFALQVAQVMAFNGHPGALYSLEMLGRAVTLRALSNASKVESRKLKTGKLDPDDWQKFVTAFEELSQLPIYMSDSVEWTTAALRSDLSRLKKIHGIEWFVIDYSYLIQDGMGKLSEMDRTQIIMSNLKGIAKTLNLAGIVIHSMTKAGMQDSSGSQAGIRGSGQVTYDADVILLLLDHQPSTGQPNPNMITAKFGKGREMDNAKKKFHLVKLPGFPAFGNYQPSSPMKP